MLPHYDTYAVLLNLRRAEREAFVDAAIAAHRPAAADRRAVIVNLPLSRLSDFVRPIRWMIRLTRT